MPTQVRIFTVPKSLGETLAAPGPASAQTPPALIPRSVPIYPEIPKPSAGSSYGSGGGTLPLIRPNAMATYNDKPAAGGITFAQQDRLPKLPIPELATTCQRYLTALKPLQTSREHAETKQAVQEFLHRDGPELQEKLRRYAEGRTSYIEQFCRSRCRDPCANRASADGWKGMTRT